MVSTSLAGATLGSFTGGSLADKFGRTRTFILDAVPLALGAFLRCVLNYLVVSRKYTLLSYMKLTQKHLQCNSSRYPHHDYWSVACWNWYWDLICSCTPLHIWGCDMLKWQLLCSKSNSIVICYSYFCLCSIATACVNEHLQQMIFLYFADLTNWNSWNTWFC